MLHLFRRLWCILYSVSRRPGVPHEVLVGYKGSIKKRNSTKASVIFTIRIHAHTHAMPHFVIIRNYDHEKTKYIHTVLQFWTSNPFTVHSYNTTLNSWNVHFEQKLASTNYQIVKPKQTNKHNHPSDTVHSKTPTTHFTNYMGVSKNRGTPKWMVYNGKTYKNGWFGGTTIFGNIHIYIYYIYIY